MFVRQVGLPTRASGVAKTLNVRHYTLTIQPDFFIPVLLIGTVNFYQFLTCTDLDLAWGSQGQHKAKPIGIIFLHTFHLIRMKFDVAMEQFKLNILRLLLLKSYSNKGNNCHLTDCIKKNKNKKKNL